MPALCSMLLGTYYAFNYAGIIGRGLPEALVSTTDSESLIKFCTFSIYFLCPSNFSWHGISSPPWIRSLENWRLPVTVHSIEPLFLKNKEQAAEIFLDTWPIISLCLTTDTAKRSNALPDSRKQGNTCPELASHISL